MNSDWVKYLWASVVTHFKNGAGTLNITVEGEDRDPNLSNYVMVSLLGPDITQVSKNVWRFDFEIIAAVHTEMDDADVYRIRKDSGLMAVLFSDINVTDSNGQYLGCAQMKNPIQIEHLGQLRVAAKVTRSMVSARYTWTVQE